MSRILNKLKELDIIIRENELLANHTTFQIGGPAKIYLEIDNSEKLIKALKIIKEENLPYLMIGGGSNLLVSDQGYDGAVIKVNPKEIKITDTLVEVDAGYSLTGLITKTLDAGLVDLEFLAGVPGTVGGAIKGNAGTFGEGMDKIAKAVNFIDDNLEIKTFTNQQCQFNYRHSIFKKRDNWLIVATVLQLRKGDALKSRQLIDERLQYRTDNHPAQPSAGSIFKNIIYTEALAAKLKSLDWEVSDKFKEYKKIPTAFIVENLGLKGKTIGSAQISEKHANYIINLGGATADQVVQLISYIKQQVRDAMGIQLEEEIRYLGF